MVSISVSEDDFGEFVASYFLILYELATPTICACLLGNYWYCRFGSFQHNIYIYSNRTCTGLRFLFVQYARQVWTKILISFRSSTVPSSSTHTTLCSERKMDKKNEKELLANPNPSLEAVATFCLFCNASLSPACPLNQVTLREFKCTTRDLQLLLITF